MKKSYKLVAVVLGTILLLMLFALRLQDSSDFLPPGTEIAGVDVGDKLPIAAEALVREQANWRGLQLQVGNRTWRLPNPEARPDTKKAVQKANQEAQDRSIPAKILGSGGKSYSLRWTYSKYALQKYAQAIAQKVNEAPLEAEPIYIGNGKIKVRPGRAGSVVPINKTVAALASVSSKGGGLAQISKVRAEPEAQNTAQARKAYPELLIVDRAERKLYFYKNLYLRKTFTVAVGMPGFETPTGKFAIDSKSIDPAWLPPDWAGAQAGQLVPGGTAENPLVSRWMGIGDGVGFHGTRDLYSLGSAASHGCIRMNPDDIIPLYEKIPLGTPVIISS